MKQMTQCATTDIARNIKQIRELKSFKYKS
jgi:hypothetical protein